MQSFLNKDGKVIVESLIKTIQENRTYLSDIDGLIGDGDHGINMNKGFTLCGERLGGIDMNFSKALETLGNVLLMEIGGSMGPLYGTFFRKMAKQSKNEDVIDKYVFGNMLKDAVKGIADLGNAKVGEKTLMDVIIPANEAFQAALVGDKEFDEALNDMKIAAEVGWLSTKDLIAKVGRASRLGERSRGVLDAGATSCKLILHSLSDEIKKLL